MHAARREWIDSQPTLDVTKLVFLDETGASTNMTRTRGRAPQGARCVASVPHGHWKTTTFIAGLRDHDITAPMVLDGPMDGEAFLIYVQTFLCPSDDFSLTWDSQTQPSAVTGVVAKFARGNYAANGGGGNAFSTGDYALRQARGPFSMGGPPTGFGGISDGLSNTIFLSELIIANRATDVRGAWAYPVVCIFVVAPVLTIRQRRKNSLCQMETPWMIPNETGAVFAVRFGRLIAIYVA